MTHLRMGRVSKGLRGQRQIRFSLFYPKRLTQHALTYGMVSEHGLRSLGRLDELCCLSRNFAIITSVLSLGTKASIIETQSAETRASVTVIIGTHTSPRYRRFSPMLPASARLWLHNGRTRLDAVIRRGCGVVPG